MCVCWLFAYYTIPRHAMFCSIKIYFISLLYQAAVSTCQRWRSRILDLPGYPVPLGVFIPECEEDGGFREVQCLGSTGECFCVTEDGFMIWSTAVRGKPNCVKKGKYIMETKEIKDFFFSTGLCL